MDSRERVILALGREQPDRIPLDLGSTWVTGMTRGVYQDLLAALVPDSDGGGERCGSPRLSDVAQQVVEMDEIVLERLDVDTRGLIPNVVRKSPQVIGHPEGQMFTDEWGLIWKRPTGGLYFDVVEHPLAGDIGCGDVEKYPWPDPSDDALIVGLNERAERYYAEGKAVILESLCAGVFEMCCRMRGFEQFCMDLVLDPTLACALMDRFVELKIAYYALAAEHLNGRILCIREGDDLAGQENLLFSPEVYRRLVRPRHARLFEAQRKLFSEPFFVFFHSDGALWELIPDLIEIGVDVLNPVQVSARGMIPSELKLEFGRDLAFWGGAVDPGVLARGPEEIIEEHVRCAVADLAPGGGYVFGTIHNVQDDVSVDHFLALWKTFDTLRRA